MSEETYYADQWLYQTLASDATLIGLVSDRFYSDLAPDTAAFPFIQWNLLSSVDVRGQGPFRWFLNCLYLVKAVGKVTGYGSLVPIVRQIGIKIDGKGGNTLAGDMVHSCTREEGYRQPEYLNGVSYRHLGAVYRILVQKG
jgi:hypothetical protein